MTKTGLTGNEQTNALTERIIRCAMLVHMWVGPGLFESAYEELVCWEFQKAGLGFERQKPMPVIYRDREFLLGYKADLVVENHVIVELKCVSQLLAVHEAQLIGYLRISGLEVGLLINFHERLLKDGIRRKFNTRRQVALNK